MTVSIFDPNADQARFQHWTRTQPPSKVYSILFTPRSGSSWLTSILASTKAMGNPAEWFNPNLMPSSSRAKGARDLDQFVEVISRHDSHGGMFGFEITHHQLRAVFKSDAAFMARFRDATFFWLTRKDIVAQGVSLDKMVQTQVSHAANTNPDQIADSDRVYDYAPDRIRKWIRHIRAAEEGTETLISTYGLAVSRLSYEAMVAAGAKKTITFFSERLQKSVSVEGEVSSSHRKIATEKNDLFAERFRSENRRFIEKIEAERAPMLALYDTFSVEA